jgi:hypothetical protein
VLICVWPCLSRVVIGGWPSVCVSFLIDEYINYTCAWYTCQLNIIYTYIIYSATKELGYTPTSTVILHLRTVFLSTTPTRYDTERERDRLSVIWFTIYKHMLPHELKSRMPMYVAYIHIHINPLNIYIYACCRLWQGVCSLDCRISLSRITYSETMFRLVWHQNHMVIWFFCHSLPQLPLLITLHLLHTPTHIDI